MVLVFQIVLGAIAAWRGWGAAPFVIIFGAFALSLLVQMATGERLAGPMQAVDFAVAAILIAMAYKGRRKLRKR
jgi:hypothetical protein